MVRDTLPSQDASTHQIWNSYLKEYRRYAPDTKLDGRRTDWHFTTIKTNSEVKVKVTETRKWYATLRHPKMHPHTKFGIPTSNNIGDMHRTWSGTDGRTDSAITICLPKFLFGHKNTLVFSLEASKSIWLVVLKTKGLYFYFRDNDKWRGHMQQDNFIYSFEENDQKIIFISTQNSEVL